VNAVWQVQEAKNRFSELLERAAHDGPQTITRHGRPVARVVAIADSPAVAERGAAPAPDDGFLAFLFSMPKSGLPEGLPAMPRRSRRSSPFEES
jgi:antitoxin Phd